MIKIGVQKGGRLSEKSLEVLKKCGIKLSSGTSKLKAVSSNFPLEVLFLRDDDIPEYVEKGVVHIGIVGENVLRETGANAKVLKGLGFGKCSLSLALPRGVEYNGVEWFNGKSIATSYPNILNEELGKRGVKAEVFDISGSVEVAPSLGVADGVFDIVSTGSTLTLNGLKEVEKLCKSEAVLVANENLTELEQDILEQLMFRMDSVDRAAQNQYILLNIENTKLEEVCNLLPGLNSPTVMPLAKEGWSCVHSVISEPEFWDIIKDIKSAGAEGIITIPIDKMFN